MRSMNARVHFEQAGRDVKEFKNVKIFFELGWILFEDQHGGRSIYPAHAVSSIEARPMSYDRGS